MTTWAPGLFGMMAFLGYFIKGSWMVLNYSLPAIGVQVLGTCMVKLRCFRFRHASGCSAQGHGGLVYDLGIWGCCKGYKGPQYGIMGSRAVLIYYLTPGSLKV